MNQNDLGAESEELKNKVSVLEAGARKPNRILGIFSRLNVVFGALVGSVVLGSVIYAVTVPNTFTDGSVISAADMNANFTALAEGNVPEGTVLAWAGTPPPIGYLLADGSAVSRSTYSALFAAIGTAWGTGNGSTTFNLPDLRGRFLRGVEGATGNDPDAGARTVSNAGGNTGDLVGSLQSDAFQGHWHNLQWQQATHAAGGNYDADAFQFSDPAAVISDRVRDPIDDGSNGTPRTTSETRPVKAYVNYIIKF